MNLFFTIIFFTVLLLIIEAIKKGLNWTSEFSRKVAHIVSAAAIFFLPYFLNKWDIIIITLLFIFLLSLSKQLNFLKSIHSVVRKTWGEIFLPTGVCIAALLFLPDNMDSFQLGVLVMGFSDGLAGIIGSKFGNYSFNILRAKKTYLGSFIFFITTFLIFLFFVQISFQIIIAIILISFLLTIIEAVCAYGLDNLILPILGGYLLMFFI